MSVDIQLKHSSQAGRVPDAGSLKPGEIAINTRDVIAYIKNADGQVVQLADGNYMPIDGGSAVSNFGSAPPNIDGGNAAGVIV